MAIFLSGGGSGRKSKIIDLAFLNRITKNKPILYIPLARKAPYRSCISWIKSNFRPLGFSNFEMINNPKKLKTINLFHYSGIYVGGGDTYKLLKELKDTKFLIILKKYIKKGGIYYGGSAGAIIIGKDIGTPESKNTYGLKNTKGLELVGKFSIYCHYKKVDKKEILDYIKLKHCDVLAIPENAGILVEDSKIKVMGPGKITSFIKGYKKIFLPGSSIKLK